MFSFRLVFRYLFVLCVCTPFRLVERVGDTCFGRKDMKNIVWLKGFFLKVWGRGNYKLCIILPLSRLP